MTDGPTDTIVSVKDLEVEFPTSLGVVRALNGVNFDIPRGKVIGIVGESGCGKSVTARAIMQIIERPGRITGGSIEFHRKGSEAAADELLSEPEDKDAATRSGGVDIAKLDPNSRGMRAIRGAEIAMIFQEPMTSLNPVYTVGSQIEEAILLHQTDDKQQAKAQAVDMLRQVGMPNPERIATSYPHELSGGMRQRAMIAMALSCHPALLIADEPTTALDVTTEAQILSLMRDLKSEIGMSIMFITHSMGVVAQLCDEVIVMYLGRVVERASVDEIFYNPKHPYTRSLLRSIPRIGAQRQEKLEVIKGSIPDPYTRLPGCTFHPRCPDYMDGVCNTIIPAETLLAGPTLHTVRCHLYSDNNEGEPDPLATEGASAGGQATDQADKQPAAASALKA
ncbi:dipeptide/oligopeptide/nickel ABC transporter ATP-binding protein [Microlunatus endophyticus]|uniref:Dipeptide/oligopeptide/nickel ABC transporter ATP-binding protein n=1 Tax=Microlunatus endophyticus TaxID=1716077 RepID=A0A917S3E5_9ACTN|nr:ABC transporter ATP-binding protein [Microlunatus endophyticus]GGL52628.1 dipeptide/oligopeptide/nickel ABC transporter ATP-binding protein [Microlunatus endophyticus]